MNKQIDLTLTAIFLGDSVPGEKITSQREYDREHAIPSRHTRWIGGLGRREGEPVRRRDRKSFAAIWGLHNSVGVTMEPWYRHIFFTKKYTKISDEDTLKAYRKFSGDNVDAVQRINPYLAYGAGMACDCCGTGLSFFNRATCYTLCIKCDKREFGGRDSDRFFRMDAPWSDELRWASDFEKKRLTLLDRITMRKNMFNRKVDEIMNAKSQNA